MARKKNSQSDAAVGDTALTREANTGSGRLLFKVSGVYGHAERLIAADSADSAWAEYMRLDGLLASDHRPIIKQVVGAEEDTDVRAD